jgi:very-short-patch-repair endonuclease
MKDVECSYCGKKIQRIKCLKNEHYYCSKECESLFTHEQSLDIRICKICGISFKCLKSDDLILCSYECQHIWQSINRCGKNSPTYNHNITDDMRIKNCEVCDKEMIGTPKEFEIKRFCSICCKLSGTAKSMTKPHRAIVNYLLSKNIEITNEFSVHRYSIDTLLENTYLAIEIMGTYWHSDIRSYPIVSNIDRLHGIKVDKEKKFVLNNEGFHVLYLWEYDIENNLDVCQKIILEFIKNKGILSNYHSMNYLIQNEELILNSEIIIPHFEI